jgi:hypothetical protein
MLAWELRGFGVPVWHDVTDLPPGDTTKRLEEALSDGLSGCVLIVTTDIENSSVVRNIELPKLIELEEQSDFTFAIASIVEGGDGQLDYGAADRYLKPSKSLGTFLYLPARDEEEVAEVARLVAAQRMVLVRKNSSSELVIDVQSRRPPGAGMDHADLVLRTRPPDEGQRVPAPSAWPPLRRGLSALPELVDKSGASSVLISGGAHLTMALAVGAALPVTSQWPLTVRDQFGNIWDNGDGAAQAVEVNTVPLEGIGPPAVFVDLVPSPEPADTFGRYVAGDLFGSATRITLAGRPLVDATVGGATTRRIAEEIRRVASAANTNRIALFLRCPFPSAVMLGRLLNTLRLALYEWDDTTDPPTYIRTITVSSGHGGSPISQIHLIDPEE